MKLLFTHENRLLVVNVKNQVEAAGIPTFMRMSFHRVRLGSYHHMKHGPSYGL